MRTYTRLSAKIFYAVVPVVVLAGLALPNLTPAGATVRTASASSAAETSLPANFSRLPAAWHGYAPPTAKPDAACSNGEAIFNKHSGKVVEVYHSSTSNGAKVDQYSYNGSQTQHWCLFLLGEWQNDIPYYEIVNNNSGKCLDLTNDKNADGTKLQQWSCLGNEQQQWLWFNEGSYDIIAPFTQANSNIGFGYLMEVYGASTANGATVDIWSGNDQSQQEWCPGKVCS